MRILVFGGRDWDDETRMFAALDHLHQNRTITVLIEGGQVSRDRDTDHLYGADWQAGTWAIKRRVRHQIFWANWRAADGGLRKQAGPERNERMLRYGRPEAAVGFPGRRGTIDMAGRLDAAGVRIWWPYGRLR